LCREWRRTCDAPPSHEHAECVRCPRLRSTPHTCADGVWMAFGLRELLEGAASIMYWSAIWAARRTAIKLTCELSNTDDDGRRTSDGFGDTPLLADGFARRLLLWWMGLLFRFTDTLCCVFVMHINFWMWCVIYWDNEPNVAFKYFWPFLDDPFGACAGSGYRHSWAGLECIE